MLSEGIKINNVFYVSPDILKYGYEKKIKSVWTTSWFKPLRRITALKYTRAARKLHYNLDPFQKSRVKMHVYYKKPGRHEIISAFISDDHISFARSEGILGPIDWLLGNNRMRF